MSVGGYLRVFSGNETGPVVTTGLDKARHNTDVYKVLIPVSELSKLESEEPNTVILG